MRTRTFLLAAALTLGWVGSAGAAEHRFGLGELYWRSIDDLDAAGLKSDGIAPYLTYQYVPAGIFKLELDLEYYRKGFGGSTSAAYSPVAWVLVEFGLYGGVGIGVTFADSLDNNVSDPFYCARLGYDFQLIPRLHFDVNANYRANTFNDLKRGVQSYDTDSITFGAAARVSF